MGLTIALNRGRILAEVLPMLREAGIEPSEDPESSRKLIFDSRTGGHRLVVMRGSDVPTYVEYGAADVGVTGKDTIMEYGGGAYFYERLDLGIGRCRLMTAAPRVMPTASTMPSKIPGLLMTSPSAVFRATTRFRFPRRGYCRPCRLRRRKACPR